MNKKILICSSIALALDQITKMFASIYLTLNKEIVLIPKFFSLTLCHNEGAAWGILNNASWLIILCTILAIFIIYHFIYCFKQNTRNNIAFGLLYGGLAGNLIDRVVYGYVRDFFDFYIFNYNYPVFNIADICIVIGVILLVIAVIKGEDLNGNKSSKTKRKTR